MSEKLYPTDPEGTKDAGIERETRVVPCPKSTWCILARGHGGECEEKNRPPKTR